MAAGDLVVNERITIPASELEIRAARSGGPGGQHVNKTSSKVIVRWSLRYSEAITTADRYWLRDKLGSKLTVEGDLLVACEEHRDQSRNKADALAKLAAMLRTALVRPKPRKATKPTRGSNERRLTAKKSRAGIKSGRQGRGHDD